MVSINKWSVILIFYFLLFLIVFGYAKKSANPLKKYGVYYEWKQGGTYMNLNFYYKNKHAEYVNFPFQFAGNSDGVLYFSNFNKSGVFEIVYSDRSPSNTMCEILLFDPALGNSPAKIRLIYTTFKDNNIFLNKWMKLNN